MKRRINRRSFVALATTGLATTALAGTASAPAFAQANYPDRPITMVVPAPPGGGTDLVTRLYSDLLSQELGVQVIVDNKGGGNGNIGTAIVARAKPDGYTLLMQYSAYHSANPALIKDLNWKPDDFVGVAMGAVAPHVIVVAKKVPASDLKSFIAYAKANPGKLSYGTPGVGTPQHIAGELFCFLAGIKMEHIPYRGANMADLMSGVVQVGIQNAGAAMPLVRDGRVRGIAVTSLKRTPSAPDLPTLAEQGFPGFEATSWFALLGPANLPRPIVDKVRAESLKVLADRELEKKFAVMGLDVVGSTPEETRAAIAADIPKWAKVIKDANIKTAK